MHYDKPLIIVVDNDTAYMEFLCDLLEEEQYRVRCLTNASEAFARIKAEQPDLVLLDQRLDAASSGWMILELLCRERTTAHIPVILCSADTRFLQDNAAQLRELHAAVLEKPFRIDDLLAKISAGIGKQLRVGATN